MIYPQAPFGSPYINDGSEHVSDFLARMGESARSSMYSSHSPETPPSSYHHNQYRISEPSIAEPRSSHDYTNHPDGVAVVDRSEHVGEFLARMGEQLGRDPLAPSPSPKKTREDEDAGTTIEDQILQGRRDRQARRQDRARSLIAGQNPPVDIDFDSGLSPSVPPSHSANISAEPVSTHRQSVKSVANTDDLLPTYAPPPETTAPIPPALPSRNRLISSNDSPRASDKQYINDGKYTPTGHLLELEKRQTDAERERRISAASHLDSHTPPFHKMAVSSSRPVTPAQRDSADSSSRVKVPFRELENEALRDVPSPAVSPTKSGQPLRDSSEHAPTNRISNDSLAQNNLHETGSSASRTRRRMDSLSNESNQENTLSQEHVAMSPSQSRLGLNSSDRPSSPTKGAGGFVQSAMKRRSDSVSKRWSHTGRPGRLTGQESGDASSVSASESGPAAGDGHDSHSGENKAHEKIDDAREPDAVSVDAKQTTSTRPKSSGGNRQDDIKRWSPTKATWLETALGRPDTFAKKPPPFLQFPNKPEWKSQLDKTRTNRANSSDPSPQKLTGPSTLPSSSGIKKEEGKPAVPAKKDSLDGKSVKNPDSAPKQGDLLDLGDDKQQSTTGVKDQTAGKEDQRKKDENASNSNNSKDDAARANKSPTEDTRKGDDAKDTKSSPFKPEKPLNSKPKTSLDTINKFQDPRNRVPSPSKQTTNPAFDFRSNLRRREVSAEKPKDGEPEFKNVFANLKRTQGSEALRKPSLRSGSLGDNERDDSSTNGSLSSRSRSPVRNDTAPLSPSPVPEALAKLNRLRPSGTGPAPATGDRSPSRSASSSRFGKETSDIDPASLRGGLKKTNGPTASVTGPASTPSTARGGVTADSPRVGRRGFPEKDEKKPFEKLTGKSNEKAEPGEKPASPPAKMEEKGKISGKPVEKGDNAVVEKKTAPSVGKKEDKSIEKPPEKPTGKPGDIIAEKKAAPAVGINEQKDEQKPNEHPPEKPVGKIDKIIAEKKAARAFEQTEQKDQQKSPERAPEKPVDKLDDIIDEKKAPPAIGKNDRKEQKPLKQPSQKPDRNIDDIIAAKKNAPSAENKQGQDEQGSTSQPDEKPVGKIGDAIAEKKAVTPVGRNEKKDEQKSIEKPAEKPVGKLFGERFGQKTGKDNDANAPVQKDEKPNAPGGTKPAIPRRTSAEVNLGGDKPTVSDREKEQASPPRAIPAKRVSDEKPPIKKKPSLDASTIRGSLPTPAQPAEPAQKSDAPPTSAAVSSGKLAGRLNPALAGLISRGPSPAAPKDQSSGLPALVSTPDNTKKVTTTNGKQVNLLVTPLKERTKGPQRRPPTKQSSHLAKDLESPKTNTLMFSSAQKTHQETSDCAKAPPVSAKSTAVRRISHKLSVDDSKPQDQPSGPPVPEKKPSRTSLEKLVERDMQNSQQQQEPAPSKQQSTTTEPSKPTPGPSVPKKPSLERPRNDAGKQTASKPSTSVRDRLGQFETPDGDSSTKPLRPAKSCELQGSRSESEDAKPAVPPKSSNLEKPATLRKTRTWDGRRPDAEASNSGKEKPPLPQKSSQSDQDQTTKNLETQSPDKPETGTNTLRTNNKSEKPKPAPLNLQDSSHLLQENDGLSPAPKTEETVTESQISPFPERERASALFESFFGEMPKVANSVSVDPLGFFEKKGGSVAAKTLSARIWRVTGNNGLEDMPPDQEYVLYEDCVYLCVHLFQDSGGNKNTHVQIWCGDSAEQALVNAGIQQARKSAKESNCKQHELLKQGHETEPFIQALGGILVIRRGSPKPKAPLARYMLRGRQYISQFVFDEVDFSPVSLCSGFANIVAGRQGKLFLWQGQGSSANEVGCARLIGMGLAMNGDGDLEEVIEGQEPAEFWRLFNTSGQPATRPSKVLTASAADADYWKQKRQHEKYSTRLFRVDLDMGRRSTTSFWSLRSDSSIGSIKRPNDVIRAVSPFRQDDLDASHIHIADNFFEIIIHVGANAHGRDAELATALMFAQEYGIMAVSMEDRPYLPRASVVMHGFPPVFRQMFRKWTEPSDKLDSNGGGGGVVAADEPDVIPLRAALEAIR